MNDRIKQTNNSHLIMVLLITVLLFEITCVVLLYRTHHLQRQEMAVYQAYYNVANVYYDDDAEYRVPMQISALDFEMSSATVTYSINGIQKEETVAVRDLKTKFTRTNVNDA